MRLLLAEDDREMNALLTAQLTRAGYAVDPCLNGGDALACLTSGTDYAAAILDIMMPVLSGLEVLAQARAASIRCPVLLLTARNAVADRVRGLDLGADDYVTKPFSAEELLARLRALIRRGPVSRDTVLRVADLALDPAAHTVTRGGRSIELSAREFSVLEYLMRNAGLVLTRTQIEENVWNYDYAGGSNVVDVYIRYLRGKVDAGESVPLIHTVRGVGYRLGRSE